MAAVTGTAALFRLIIRRDRIRLLLWIVGITGFFVIVASSFPDIYPTAEERQARATLMENPTAMAFRGPGHGLENYTYGAMLAHELLGYAAIATALMSIFLVVRHTRAEEETDRLELVRAAVVGRYAAPVAALTIAALANLAIAALFTMLLPLSSSAYSLTGSLAFGIAVTSVGVVFAAIAAVTAQLSEYGRGAAGMAVIALGVAYILRAIGDVQGNILSWLSPFGWGQGLRAFVDERWWPLLITLGVASALVTVAFGLVDRRDVGAGLMPQKPGPTHASDLITHPVGFALRRQLGSLIGWSLGLATIGVAFGSLLGDVEEFIADVSGLGDFLGAGSGEALIDAFLALILLVMALLASAFAIQSTTRLRSEENEGRAEAVLATAISRPSWMWSYLTLALLGSAAVFIAGGLGVGITAAIDQRNIDLLLRVLGATLAYLPAVWLMAGISAALFGFIPRAGAAVWLLLVYGFFVGLFGQMMQLPGWMFELSPYEHIPELSDEFSIVPIIVLTLLTAALLIIGLIGFYRRDLETA